MRAENLTLAVLWQTDANNLAAPVRVYNCYVGVRKRFLCEPEPNFLWNNYSFLMHNHKKKHSYGTIYNFPVYKLHLAWSGGLYTVMPKPPINTCVLLDRWQSQKLLGLP
jgi:hypothetical protein